MAPRNKHYPGQAAQAQATVRGVRKEFDALTARYRQVHAEAVALAEAAMKARDQGTSSPYKELEKLVALLKEV